MDLLNQGIIHRDIKMGNIMIEDDLLFIIDFGMCKNVSK